VLIEDSTANSHVHDRLEKWSLYEIVMTACKEVGASQESQRAIEQTREAEPTFGPEGVDANSSSSTTIVVKWGEVPRDHHQQGLKTLALLQLLLLLVQ
jgi:protein sidekick